MGNKLNNNIGSIVFLVVFYSLPHSLRFDCLFFHCVTLMCDEWTVSPFKYPSAPSQKEEERKKHGTEENLFPCLVCRFAKKDRRKRERRPSSEAKEHSAVVIFSPHFIAANAAASSAIAFLMNIYKARHHSSSKLDAFLSSAFLFCVQLTPSSFS